MSPEERSREQRLRYQLRCKGFKLCKTPARSWLRYYGVGYQVVNDRNVVVMGCGSREYQASLEDVESFLMNHLRERMEREAA